MTENFVVNFSGALEDMGKCEDPQKMYTCFPEDWGSSKEQPGMQDWIKFWKAADYSNTMATNRKAGWGKFDLTVIANITQANYTSKKLPVRELKDAVEKMKTNST